MKDRIMSEQREEQYGVHPTLCPDGKYRWTYEVNLLKNPSMFYDLMLVMCISLGVVFVTMLAGLLYGDNLDWESLSTMALAFLGISVFFFFLCLLGYVIWAGMSGWRYAALFTMDDVSITHEQMPKEVKRGQVIGEIASLVGMAGGTFSTVGAGLLAASINAWKSDFRSVRKVKVVRRRHLIKVNELLTKNRIYAEREDLDFVAGYIRQRSPKVKK